MKGVCHVAGGPEYDGHGWKLAENELEQACEMWKGKPVYLEHMKSLGRVGTVERVERGPKRTMVAVLTVDTSTKAGEIVERGLNEGKYRGLSLGHAATPYDGGTKSGNIRAREVSICERPAWPGSDITAFSKGERAVFFVGALEKYISMLDDERDEKDATMATAEDDSKDVLRRVPGVAVPPATDAAAAAAETTTTASPAADEKKVPVPAENAATTTAATTADDDDDDMTLEEFEAWKKARGFKNKELKADKEKLDRERAAAEEKKKKRAFESIIERIAPAMRSAIERGKLQKLDDEQTKRVFDGVVGLDSAVVDCLAGISGNAVDLETERLKAIEERDRQKAEYQAKVADFEKRLASIEAEKRALYQTIETKSSKGLETADDRFRYEEFANVLRSPPSTSEYSSPIDSFASEIAGRPTTFPGKSSVVAVGQGPTVIGVPAVAQRTTNARVRDEFSVDLDDIERRLG